MPLIKNFHYRPEIDGLRALAVLAVVFYHAGISFLDGRKLIPGGFVGVDVFFVISGYLITSLLIKDLDAGTFTLVNFWERRIRRILPALVVVVLATLAVGWFLLLPDDYALLGKSAFFQAICAANIYYWRIPTGYFAGDLNEQPLLHTWSLAVEEQFYLIVPILLLSIFLFPVLRRRGVLLSLLGVGMLCSLVLSTYGVSRYPNATFYLLPTRAWELMLGSFVCLLPASTLNQTLREILAGIALVGIIIPCIFYTSQTLFPGMAALPPCLGTALFIWVAGQATTNIEHGTPGRNTLPIPCRILATRPVVFIGLISYSLYLWHWPFLAFSTYWDWKLSLMTRNYRLAMVALSLLLAALSWRFVETPFRKRLYCSSRKSIFVFGALSISFVAALGTMLHRTAGFPQRLSEEAQNYARSKSDWGTFGTEVSVEDVTAGNLIQIGVCATPETNCKWLVWGDSHATAALPAFDALLKIQGQSGQAAIYPATPPVLGYFNVNPYLHSSETIAFNNAVFTHLKAHRIPNVILIAYWNRYGDKDIDQAGNHPFSDSLIATVQQIVQAGSRPWILLDVPNHSFDVPRGLALFSIHKQDIAALCAKPDPVQGLPDNDPRLVSKLREAGAVIIDPRPAFLSEDRSHYVVAIHGTALYKDRDHLSKRGAETVLLPLLRESILSATH